MPCRRSHKYWPLGRYLAAQPGTTVTLTFGAIERLISAPLPASAQQRQWWSNARRLPYTRVWLDAGWRVVAVDEPGRTVTFGRVDSTP